MTDINKLADVQPDVLRCLSERIVESLGDLDMAEANRRMSAVAWITRNLLELMVWTRWCLQSKDNAKQLVIDAGRDVTETLRTVGNISPDSKDPDAGIAIANEWAKEIGLETLEDRYTRVSKAATEVGKGAAFRDVNKLLSKFAHPTALSIVYSNSETIDTLRKKFYGVGRRLGEDTLNQIINAK